MANTVTLKLSVTNAVSPLAAIAAPMLAAVTAAARYDVRRVLRLATVYRATRPPK